MYRCARLGLVFLFLGMVGITTAQDKKDQIEGGLRCFVVYDRRAEKDPLPEDAKACDLVKQVKDRTKLKTELNRTGTFLCPISENGLFPTIAVFSRTIPKTLEEPLAVFLKKQDDFLSVNDEKNLRFTDYRSARLGVFGVFGTLVKDLQDDAERDKSIDLVCRFGNQAKLVKVLLGVAEGTIEKDGNIIPNPQLTSLGITPEDETVIVFYSRLEVIQRWKFTKEKPLAAEDIDAIIAVVDSQLLKKKKK